MVYYIKNNDFFSWYKIIQAYHYRQIYTNCYSLVLLLRMEDKITYFPISFQLQTQLPLLNLGKGLFSFCHWTIQLSPNIIVVTQTHQILLKTCLLFFIKIIWWVWNLYQMFCWVQTAVKSREKVKSNDTITNALGWNRKGRNAKIN